MNVKYVWGSPLQKVLSEADKIRMEERDSHRPTLELIIGPMFSGKSTELLSRIHRFKAIRKHILVITHMLDTRYTQRPLLVNHDAQSAEAIACETLMPLIGTHQLQGVNVVIIEEAQFFADLVPFVKHVVEVCKVHCVVAGLDGDAERKPFGHVLELIPLADTVKKLTAMCQLCCDGSPGIFSFMHTPPQKKHTGNPSQVLVGADERYMALCRHHYLEQYKSVYGTIPELNLSK